jgi:hypothetical protein
MLNAKLYGCHTVVFHPERQDQKNQFFILFRNSKNCWGTTSTHYLQRIFASHPRQRGHGQIRLGNNLPHFLSNFTSLATK